MLFETNKFTKLDWIKDGLSNTLMLTEIADRPNRWRKQTLVNDKVGGAGWASAEAAFEFEGANPNAPTFYTAPAFGTALYGSCVINCTNEKIYSFHPGGVNILFGDGAVRFASEQMNPLTLLFLISRNGKESVDPNDL